MMNDYEIRLCKACEYERLIDFIRLHWDANHIFVSSKQILDFQHLNKEDKLYNFIVAYNKETQKFDAILGFIPLKHYDACLDNKDFWLAIWKVNPLYSKRGIALALLYFFIKTFNPRSLGGINISKKAQSIYKALKYKIVRLEHFYIANSSIKKFKIAHFHAVKSKKIPSLLHCKKMDIKHLCDFKNTNTPPPRIRV